MMLCAAGILAVTLAVLVALSNKKSDTSRADAGVPAPLAIGTVSLEDGSVVRGFVAEPRALTGALDITTHGGWRAYLASRGKP